MTRLRRARLAGEFVALGICHFQRCDTVDLIGQAVCVVRSGISPAREGRKSSDQILGSYVLTFYRRPKGRFSFTRLTSVSSTTTCLPSLRLLLELLHSSKWRRPAFERTTLPVAVILNRFATDLLVLLRAIAFGMGGGRFQSESELATIKRLNSRGDALS